VRQPKNKKESTTLRRYFILLGCVLGHGASAPVAHCALLCLTLGHQFFGFALLRLFASYAGRYQLTRTQHDSSQQWLRLVEEPRSKPTLGKRGGGRYWYPFLPSLPLLKKKMRTSLSWSTSTERYLRSARQHYSSTPRLANGLRHADARGTFMNAELQCGALETALPRGKINPTSRCSVTATKPFKR